MPRAARNFAGGLPHHVIARANGGMRLFRGPPDYVDFLELMAAALERRPLEVLGFCLMPNHLHFVLQPEHGSDLSRFMQWLLTTHAARWHRRRGSSGHVWQGRFKAFAIQDDRHLWTVLRYVERNAVRAQLAPAAEDWPWCSLAARLAAPPPAWLRTPTLPPGWREWVNEPQSAAELDEVRRSVNRGAPFGDESWTRRTRRRSASPAPFAPAAGRASHLETEKGVRPLFAQAGLRRRSWAARRVITSSSFWLRIA